nr:uncharacterized protein LOC112803626 [Arachis hypogaea]
MEENSRLGETSKTKLSYPPRDKDKEHRKKEDQPTEKPRKYHNYTPLRVSPVDVYQEVCNTEKIPRPRPIKHKRGGSQTEYCEYHRIYGHTTNECYDLKNVIEKLARKGRVDRFIANKVDEPKKRRRDEEGRRAERPPHTPERHVHMINREFEGGGISKSSRKRHLKEVYHVGESDRSFDLPTITFNQEDATGVISGHDDPVVVIIILANANLHRTLELKAYPNSLFGLGDAPIQPLGYIPLHTTFVKGTRSRTLSIDYIVVNVSSAYNALIGQTTLNQLTAVVSTPHLCMKFPTPEGIVTIKGDQKLARCCYNESMNLKSEPRGKETSAIELGGIRVCEELRPQPEGETEEVQIGDTQEKTINIGMNLKGDLKELLTKLLKDNSDLFAWKAADMPGINSGLMCHKLAVYPGSRPVQ